MLLSDVPDFCYHNEHSRPRVSVATLATYHNTVKRLIDLFGDVDVESLEEADLLDFEEWLANRDISHVTQNTYKRTARAILNYLRKSGIQVVDPTGLFTMSKEPRGAKAISKRNAIRMLAYSGIRETALLMLVDDSARRRGGMANLKISDLNFFEDEDGSPCVIGHTIEKGDKPQILLAGKEAVLALQVWLHIRGLYLAQLKIKDHGYVFINLHDGSPLTPNNMTSAVSRLRQKAGIPAHQPAGLHSRRHRRAKELLKVLSLPEVRDLLGHAEAATTADIYAVNGEEELAAAFFERVKKKGL